MKKILLLFILLLTSTVLFSQKTKEMYYERQFAEFIHGRTEVRLSDKSRIDILTDTFAIEVEFAAKWPESIGQSLYYAEMTSKKPGIVLIMDYAKEKKYLNRLVTVAVRYGITVWVMDYTDDSVSRLTLVH